MNQRTPMRILRLLVLLLGWPAATHAQFSFTTNSDGTLALTGYSGTNEHVVIPGMTNGLLVTSIASNALLLAGWSYTIPATITSLAPAAFFAPIGGDVGLIYFQGNAPAATNAFVSNFPYFSVRPTIYCLAGTTGWGTNFNGHPTRIWHLGQLQLFIAPTNAALDGMQWQVDDGPWLTNGATAVDLSDGSHTVNFKAAKGWLAPPSETVSASTNYITVVTGTPFFALPGGPSHPTFQVLHTFVNSDGAHPQSILLLFRNRLYGTALNGGAHNRGVIFAINCDGTGFTNLYQFTGTNDGAYPHGDLALTGNTLYGTTVEGGTNDTGAIYSIKPDGSDFKIIYSFTAALGQYGTNTDGTNPQDGLLIVSNRMYGVAQFGGHSTGTVFTLNTDGTDFTTLFYFGHTNSTFDQPFGTLAISGDTLYGTTVERHVNAPFGGPFSIHTDGSHYFEFPCLTHSRYGLNLYRGILYGGDYKVNPDGTGFTPYGLQSACWAGSVISGHTLYGAALQGGIRDAGVIFSANIDSTDIVTNYNFTGGSDGGMPEAALTLSGTILYGTTQSGGTNENGTIYMLTFPPPQLAITQSGANLIFTWPSGTSGAGYDAFSVQSTTNLTPPVAWDSVPVPAVLANGLNTVTNPIPDVPTFYRLSQ